jgi:ATP-dependent DNA helicase PIF1
MEQKEIKIEKNHQFSLAFDRMEHSDQNIFITGKAGTGKSTLLNFFCQNTQKSPVVLAPTGVAALHVKGATIHRFFNFYIDVTQDKILNKEIRPRNPELYQNLKTIIIDEASMLRADLLDCVDTFLKTYGPKLSHPFGGVQMIFVGDLYQLPPVVGPDEKDIFRSHYATPYFFSAKAMEHTSLEVIELEKIYRQKDKKFIKLLNKIRNNSVEEQDIITLNQRYNACRADLSVPASKALVINLTTTNQKADEINADHLSSLSGKEFCSHAVIRGDFGRDSYPTATELHYKVGAQIMLLNNDSMKRWVNGSIGIIESSGHDDEGEKFLSVRLQDQDSLVSVKPFTWDVYRFFVQNERIVSEPAGSFTQYPFRLAWAITIHKSQGKTFDHVIIDLGRGTFASGQTYVALSRCTSFEGIQLKSIVKKHHVRSDPRIWKFMTSHAYKKAELSMPIEERLALIEEAISNKIFLDMTYLKSSDTKSQRTILPLSIGEEIWKDKLFTGLLAFCLQRNENRMFNVARILDLKISSKKTVSSIP